MKKVTLITFCYLLPVFLLVPSYSAQAQTNFPVERDYKVRPVRLGLKIGFPNVVGGNVEYVTPLLNDRLAVSLDYSSIKSDWFMSEEDSEDLDNTTLDLSYIEGGINYYFFKAGKGLYGGVSYNQIKLEGQTSVSENGQEGVGQLDFNHSSFSVKLGAKLGGLFYFRPEIGYSFSPLPKSFEYTARYGNGDTETETYDLSEEVASVDILFKGLIANIGFGFSF